MDVRIEKLTIEDYEGLLDAMKLAYPKWQGMLWSASSIALLIRKFPQGQFVVKVNDEVVGCALSLILEYHRHGEAPTHHDITGNYSFSTHSPHGDVMYGIEAFIIPKYRGMRLARRLYDARKKLCQDLNLKAIVIGGRIPGYHLHAEHLKPGEYIQKVKDKEIYDPVLSFQLNNDFHVKKVLKDYVPDDEESLHYATRLRWDNIYYQGSGSREGDVLRKVRLGMIQMQMRMFKSKQAFFQQIEYFIDSISSYKADFAVLPEFFNAPLLGHFKSLTESQAMRSLAEYTGEIKEKILEMAVKYNVNIITGSMPVLKGGQLLNEGYLCHRNGAVDFYEKIHITPDEEKYWGLAGGNKLNIFNTDSGKIGILICYDVEFPELARLLADEGMQILFVPFLTDTQNAFMRVRNCAAARAIENECFVAITGSVGNLPQVENMDLHYSQSIVFTPCDYAFPYNGIKSESTPNSEMILISDVDLRLLKELHNYGSVRNLRDRRPDFYQLKRTEHRMKATAD